MVCLQTTHCAILLWSRLFGQRFLVRPFTGRDRVVRIDADVWTAPCVDADPVSCAHRIALAGEQETRVVHHTRRNSRAPSRRDRPQSDAPAPQPAMPTTRRRQTSTGPYSS